ncbi:MAG: TolC family protein [Candidatus Moduliflexus flocculans]|nr:TolC family protein [Candidatus Moduliflexus flocculans]
MPPEPGPGRREGPRRRPGRRPGRREPPGDKERFKQGVALSSDVLDAEVALLQAKLGRTQAAIDQVVAQARLEKALGE